MVANVLAFRQIHFALVLISQAAFALKDGLARTPQMGWNTWYSFGCNISEEIVVSSAELMVQHGFRDLGYEYVLIDDCWSAGRSSSGHLQVNSTKFPNGMAHVADRIHELSMKVGIYSDAGNWTCGGYEGSLGHEEIDAQTWASWGIDYLKYDNCNNDGQSGTPQISSNRYKRMGRALNATGRPILYSMCNWGEDYPWTWAQSVAHSWRITGRRYLPSETVNMEADATTGDVWDMFDRYDPRCPCEENEGLDCKEAGFYCSMMNVANKAALIISKGGPGNWNDLDMIQAGQGGCTDGEYKTQMSLWSAIKSPIIIGTDLRKMDAKTISIYQNTAVIAVSQDALGGGVNRRWRYYVDQDKYGKGEIQMWAGTLQGPKDPYGFDMLVIFVNAGNSDRRMNATLAEIFFDYGPEGKAAQIQNTWDVYDLWGARMDNDTANAILNGTEPTASLANGTARWNATANGGYASIPESDNVALMGTKVGAVFAGGTLFADVPRHDVAMLRLRAHPTGTGKKSEL